MTSSRAAYRSQYDTLYRLSDVAKLYDDLYWQNYAKPSETKPVNTYSEPAVTLRRPVSHTEVQRLKKITAALDTLLAKKLPNKAALTAALTPAEYQAYTASLDIAMTHEEAMYGGEKPPHDLKRYNELLRAADLLDYRYDAKGQNINGHKVESCYEDAVQYLADIYDAEVAMWLDRSFDPNAQDCTSRTEVPRVLGSKSKAAIDALPKLSKRIKQKLRMIEALLVAAFDIAYVTPPKTTSTAVNDQVDTEKLQKMMKSLGVKR